MKILFVSYAFPPISSPGSLRVYHFSKYLAEQEQYDVDVLYCDNGYSSMLDTKQNWEFNKIGLFPVADLINKNKIVSAVGIGGKKKVGIKSFLRGLVFPDRDITWFFSSIKNYKVNKKYDYIFCSYPNITNLIAGFYISKKTNTPLIVDMRDLWVQDSSYLKKMFIRRFLEKKIEKNILEHASKILSVSEFNTNKLASIYGNKVFTVYNGFDSVKFNDFLSNSIESIQSEKFRLVYAGSFYEGERKVDALFKAIKRLKDQGEINSGNFVFEIYGNSENYIKKLINEYNLDDFVTLMGLFGQKELFSKIVDANLLLVVTRDLEISQGEMTTKFFEYIALGNDILCLSKQNYEIVKVLKNIENSYFCDLDDSQAIETLLKSKMKNLKILFKTRRQVDYSFSRNSMSEKLKCILEK